MPSQWETRRQGQKAGERQNFMKTIESDAVQILHAAINDCRNQAELTECAMQIHQITPSHSDDERSLIVLCAAKGIQLDMLEMDARDRMARDFSRN